MKIKSAWWHVAYRQKHCGTLLEDHDSEFKLISNNPLLYAMDPFVFEYENDTYIFAEVYSILRSRGTIGYSKFDGKKFSRWKPVIIEKYHLSFPNIFQYNGSVYIVPEAYQSGEVYAYRAVHFPDKWEKVHVFISEVQYVDTAFVMNNGENYAFTYDIGNGEPKSLYRYRISDGKFLKDDCKLISSDDSVARLAGQFICYDGDLFRVSQDCDGCYGKALVFSRVDRFDENHYHDNPIFRFGINDINLDKKVDIRGIHTYNGSEHFEVVDIKGEMFHPVGFIMKIINKAKRIFHIKVSK